MNEFHRGLLAIPPSKREPDRTDATSAISCTKSHQSGAITHRWNYSAANTVAIAVIAARVPRNHFVVVCRAAQVAAARTLTLREHLVKATDEISEGQKSEVLGIVERVLVWSVHSEEGRNEAVRFMIREVGGGH